MEFGKRLYELRKKAGLSQEELAEVLDVTRQTVSKWEVGDSTPDMAKLIAMGAFFGICLDELVLGRPPEGGLRKQFTLQDKKVKTALRYGLTGAGAVLALDAVSFLVYLLVWGIPG
ncbi:MAG: helix-turn-helix transcriptional regulator [Oscillospiraceae bacterium]|nr:helix-turn-helix transcriptional regulator [Oscillospiraceae bacterium]